MAYGGWDFTPRLCIIDTNKMTAAKCRQVKEGKKIPLGRSKAQPREDMHGKRLWKTQTFASSHCKANSPESSINSGR